MVKTKRAVRISEVHSSGGIFNIDHETGRVLSFVASDPEDDDLGDLNKITRFNLVEYEKVYGELDSAYDILDLGYWTNGPKDGPVGPYEPPEYSWRKQIESEKS